MTDHHLSYAYYMVLCDGASVFFFFKQKTAYEMRISDWSSDVCSSDLTVDQHHRPRASGVRAHLAPRQPRAVEALEEPRLSRGVCQRSSSSDRRAACARR